MLKAISTWFRSRGLQEDLVAQRADVAAEQWDQVPFAAPLIPPQPEPRAGRRPTPPPLPPAATRPRLTPVRAEPARQPAPVPAAVSPPGAGEWQADLLALAKSTVSPVDPADVPTPPPLTSRKAALPPPTIAPRKAPSPPPASSQAVPAEEDEDWDAVIARAKSGPVKSPGSSP